MASSTTISTVITKTIILRHIHNDRPHSPLALMPNHNQSPLLMNRPLDQVVALMPHLHLISIIHRHLVRPSTPQGHPHRPPSRKTSATLWLRIQAPPLRAQTISRSSQLSAKRSGKITRSQNEMMMPAISPRPSRREVDGSGSRAGPKTRRRRKRSLRNQRPRALSRRRRTTSD